VPRSEGFAALAQEDTQFSTVASSNQQLDRPAFGYYAFFGLEEWLQYGLEGWFKNIALGTNYRVDMLSDDALYEGLIGALTASFMEGPGIVADTATSYFKGKQLIKAGVTGEQLAQIGKTMSVDIQKLTSRLNENSSPYAIGRAFREIGAMLSEDNVNRLVNGLQSRGLTKNDATILAHTINSIAVGQELSEQQIEMLNANEGISKVFVEMMHDPDAYTEVAEVMDRSQAFTEIAAASEQTASTQNTALQQHPSAENSQPQQAAFSNQALLQQAEEILGAENLTSQDRNLLATYRQHLNRTQELEQQLQALMEQKAPGNSPAGTQPHSKFSAWKNSFLLFDAKAQLADANNTLRQVMSKPRFVSFLQKLQAADAAAKKNSKIQTNVLDSLENHGIMNEDIVDSVLSSESANSPQIVNIQLKFKEGWTQEQKDQARMKLRQLSEMKTIKTSTKRPSQSMRQKYMEAHKLDSLPDDVDVDHILDLQLGGDATSVENLQLLDRSVNRSLGAQIRNAIKDYPPGTIFGVFTIV